MVTRISTLRYNSKNSVEFELIKISELFINNDDDDRVGLGVEVEKIFCSRMSKFLFIN